MLLIPHHLDSFKCSSRFAIACEQKGKKKIMDGAVGEEKKRVEVEKRRQVFRPVVSYSIIHHRACFACGKI